MRLNRALGVFRGGMLAVGILLHGYHDAAARSSVAPAPLPNRLLVRFTPGVSVHEEAAVHALAGAHPIGRIPGIGVRIVHAEAGRAAAALAAYRSDPLVQFAERDLEFSLAAVPNDPAVEDQWYVDQIGAAAGWDAARSARSVKVAFLDSGIHKKHPDLRKRVKRSRNLLEPGRPANDDNGHGTAVAGLVAARFNNGVGIAGLAPNAKLLVAKVAEDGGFAQASDLAAGLVFAANKGAKVINMSVSGPDVATLRTAIEYAASRDVVLVAAADNQGSSTPTYPAGYSEVLAVGATDQDDQRAGFSNFGPWVDLAAPGIAILTLDRAGGITPASGTSMAAPMVTAAAAILRGMHPHWSAQRVRDRLCDTAEETPGSGVVWSCGRLDVAGAVGLN